MDFFAAQDDARLRTRHLLLYFGLAVFAIVVAVNVAIYLATLPSSLRTDLYDYYRIKWTTILTLVAIGWACFLRIRELRSRGGKGLCENLGGRRVDFITRNPAERRLVNVAEELSIAAGMAVPHLYVLERERGINALAAGFEVDDASVAVTKGALEELTRDELQGLVAHEFSHILNGDMRLNTTLCGWLEGILVLTIVGKGILRMTDQEEDAVHLFTARRREVPPLLNPLVLGGLLVGATGYIGHVAACAIQRAICREREFLADAAAVQFTRNPHGLADALRRIGGYRQTSRVRSAKAPGLAHAFFAPPEDDDGDGTHPPLNERIRRILPSWDGTFMKPHSSPEQSRHGTATPDAAGPALPGARPSLSPEAAALVTLAGRMRADGREYALYVKSAIDRDLRETLDDPRHSAAALLALLIDPNPSIALRQFEIIDALGTTAWAPLVRQYVEPVAALGRDKHLPLLELTAPRVAEALGSSERNLFLDTIDKLVMADLRLDIFEILLRRLVRRRLGVPASAGLGTTVYEAASSVFAALIRVSTSDPRKAAALLKTAVAPAADLAPRVQPAPVPSVEALDAALDILSIASQPMRKQVIEVCERIIASDQRVEIAEIELLRAVASAMGVPMPPVMRSAAAATVEQR